MGMQESWGGSTETHELANPIAPNTASLSNGPSHSLRWAQRPSPRSRAHIISHGLRNCIHSPLAETLSSWERHSASFRRPIHTADNTASHPTVRKRWGGSQHRRSRLEQTQTGHTAISAEAGKVVCFHHKLTLLRGEASRSPTKYLDT
ncbi:hypothetical protein QQF64_032807 [Cirrhinus molitorella]|uniref:Uncharacterized protein n=1 Tax=Cirrhinus molitorella TaxID=172907 RepID=A0ABR3MS39_9TELE